MRVPLSCQCGIRELTFGIKVSTILRVTNYKRKLQNNEI